MKERKIEKYERFLEETTPEERARLLKEGIEIDKPGERVKWRAQNPKEVQAVKLQKLMERFDVPLEMPEDREEIYQAPIRIKMVQGAGIGPGGGEFHVYRMSKRKEFAKEEVAKLDAIAVIVFLTRKRKKMNITKA